MNTLAMICIPHLIGWIVLLLPLAASVVYALFDDWKKAVWVFTGILLLCAWLALALWLLSFKCEALS